MGIDDHRDPNGGPLLKEYMDRVRDPRDPPGTRWPSGDVTSDLGKHEDSFAAEVRLRRERRVHEEHPQEAGAKRSETISANLKRIAIGFAEIETRLDGVVARFAGGTEKKNPGTEPPLTNEAHFLGSVSGRAADLEMTLKRLSAICDRLDELV